MYPFNVVRNTCPFRTLKTLVDRNIQWNDKLGLDKPQSNEFLDLFYGLQLLLLYVSLDQVLLPLMFRLINLNGFLPPTCKQIDPPVSIFRTGCSFLYFVSLIYLICFLDGVLILKYVHSYRRFVKWGSAILRVFLTLIFLHISWWSIFYVIDCRHFLYL